MQKRLFIAVLAAVTVGSGASSLQAGSYAIRHTWNLNLNAGAGQVYRVRWDYDLLSEAEGKGAAKMVTPSAGTVGPVVAPAASVAPPAVATSGTVTATTNSQFSAAANGTGFHEVTGNVTLGNQGILGVSEGKSAVQLNLGTKDARGGYHWTPKWYLDTIGVVRDPVTFTATNNDDGSVESETVWDSVMMFTAPGVTTWDAGVLAIDGTEGSFSLKVGHDAGTHLTDINGSGAKFGELSFDFSGGMISASTATGYFASLATNVQTGTSMSNFSLALPSDFDFDFDFGAANTNGYEFQADYSNSGMITESVPLPGPFALGLVGLGTALVTNTIRRRRR